MREVNSIHDLGAQPLIFESFVNEIIIKTNFSKKTAMQKQAKCFGLLWKFCKNIILLIKPKNVISDVRLYNIDLCNSF